MTTVHPIYGTRVYVILPTHLEFWALGEVAVLSHNLHEVQVRHVFRQGILLDLAETFEHPDKNREEKIVDVNTKWIPCMHAAGRHFYYENQSCYCTYVLLLEEAIFPSKVSYSLSPDDTQ